IHHTSANDAATRTARNASQAPRFWSFIAGSGSRAAGLDAALRGTGAGGESGLRPATRGPGSEESRGERVARAGGVDDLDGGGRGLLAVRRADVGRAHRAQRDDDVVEAGRELVEVDEGAGRADEQSRLVEVGHDHV